MAKIYLEKRRSQNHKGQCMDKHGNLCFFATNEHSFLRKNFKTKYSCYLMPCYEGIVYIRISPEDVNGRV